MFVQKKRDEKTFFVAGVKKTNPQRSKMTLYVICACLFIPVTQNVFSMRNFFARIENFHMNTQIFGLIFCHFKKR